MLKVSTGKKSDRIVRRAARLRLGAAVFLRFMRDVAKWTTMVESRLSKLYIKAGVDNVIELYAIPRSMKYDFELRRLLSEFVLVQEDATELYAAASPCAACCSLGTAARATRPAQHRR